MATEASGMPGLMACSPGWEGIVAGCPWEPRAGSESQGDLEHTGPQALPPLWVKVLLPLHLTASGQNSSLLPASRSSSCHSR